MSVSLLPSSVSSHLRSLLVSLSTASKSLTVSESRGELGRLLKQYGEAARRAALQIAAKLILQEQGSGQTGAAGGGGGAGSPVSVVSSSSSPSSPPPSALGSKALEAWLSEEVCELQRREPSKWPIILCQALEQASSGGAPASSPAPSPSSAGRQSGEEGLVQRLAHAANLSLRHALSLAVQLQRSPLPRMQHASLSYLSSVLSLSAIASDHKSWAAMPEELLAEVSYLLTAHPTFPQEHKQQVLQTLAKLQASGDRSRAHRDDSSDLLSGVSGHAQASSHVADVLQDLGYSISSSIESLKEAMHPFPKLSEQDVASILIMILRTQYAKLHSEGSEDAAPASSAPPPAKGGKKDGKGGANKPAAASNSLTPPHSEGWHIANVIDAIKELTSSSSSSSSLHSSRLNWKHILENEIDHPKLLIADEKTFQLYLDIYRYATTGQLNATQPFQLQIDFLLRDWKHSAGHLSMLRWALPSTLTLFSYLPPTPATQAYAGRSSKSILPAANAGGSNEAAAAGEQEENSLLLSLNSNGSPAAQKEASSQRYQCWLSLDLLESLLESIPSVSSSGSTSAPAQSLYASLRSLLSLSLERCPDLLLTGLISTRPKAKASTLKDEPISCMLPVHLAIAPHPATAQSFQKLWDTASSGGHHSPSSHAQAQAQALAGKAAIFWVVKYWMMNGPSSSLAEGSVSPGGSVSGLSSSNVATSAGLLPPILIALGFSLKSFLEKLLQVQQPTQFSIDLFTTQGAAAAGSGAVPPPAVSFNNWFQQKYASDMTSHASKELFLSILFSYVKDNLDSPSASAAGESGMLPFRLSVESVAILLKALLTLPNAPPSLINDVQNYYAAQSAHHQQLQPQHMNIIGTNIYLHANAGQTAGSGGHMMLGAQMSPTSSMLAGGASGVSLLSQHSGQQGLGVSPATGLSQLNEGALGSSASNPSSSPSGSSGPSDEIEEEANSYFQKIYTGAMSLEGVIDMLLRFRASSSKRERDVGVCMVHNLFDEYRFYSKYPLKELQITGLLFGALIQHKLVSGFTLGIALRYVLEALRKAPDSKMFSFGLWAVGQFKQRITNWPQYAMLILHIPHIQTAQPELANFLQQIVATHQQGGNMEASAAAAAAAAGEVALDFSAHGTSAFGTGFHADAQTFSSFTSLREAERHADLQASAAKSALERASAAANLTADSHLPPGLGLGLNAPKAPATPGPALAAGVVLAGSNPAPTNPAGAIGGTRATTGGATTSVTGGGSTGTTAPSSSFGSTLNIDSLLMAEGDAPLPLAPSETLKDKIHFIINNVTKSNLRQKGRELRQILKPEYIPYFSRYLVIKRVSIEANFQRLYAQFLDYVGLPELRHVMLETTMYNIQVLLRNDKIVSSSSERSLLKNLGSWLGLLTIAKNKPIRARYLDVKQLILEAYDTGRLIAVIPFCAKVLECCAESKVFRPPNPWLMSVVGLLREIFDLPGLKLNLKFEIEVLFNHLVINMKEVKSTSLLKHRTMHQRNSRQNEANKQASAAAAAANMGAAQANTPFPLLPTPNPLPPLPKTGVPPLKSGAALTGLGLGGMGTTARSPSPGMSEEMGNTFGPPSVSGSSAVPLSDVGSLLLPNLSQYVVLSPSIALFQLYPTLKRCVPTALDRAIREIINPVVERSLAIACVTSRELILKDFALEPDENKMRAASHSMVSNLTASLALVTCKEPLRVSITNHLNQLLEANTNPSDRAMVERACMQVAADNLELGTTLIEKAAAERAIREIDEQLAPVYQMRRKTGYIDMAFFQPSNRYAASLPEALRAKPGVGLAASQLRVYDDFARIRSQHAAAAAAAPQTGTDKAVPKEGTSATAAPAQGLPPSLLRPEDADKKGASAFAAPAVGARVGVAPQGLAAPGSAAPSSRSPPLAAAQPSNLTAQQTLDKLLGYLATLEQAVLRFPNHRSIPLHSLTSAVQAQGSSGQREDQEINVLMRLMAALLQQTARDEANYPKDLVPLTFALKVFKRLYERENRSSLLQIDVHIGVLKCIRAVCPKLLPELTAWLLFADDDRKFILPITAGLLRARLLNTADLDLFLSKLATQIFASGQAVTISSQPNPSAPAGSTPSQITTLHPQFEFILTLVRRVVVKRPIVSVSELTHLLDTLNKIGQQAQQQQRTKLLADHIAHLLEDVRTAAILAEKERSEQERQLRAGAEGVDKQLGEAGGSLSALGMPPLSLLDGDESDSLDRLLELDESEPSGLRQQCMYLLDDWMSICLQQGHASDKAYSSYLNVLQQQRLLSTPDATQRFFRMLISLSVEAALNSVTNPPTADGASQSATPTMSYTAIDALAKLLVFLLKFLEQTQTGPNGQPIPSPNNTSNKILLLRSFLTAACVVLRKDQAQKNAAAAAAAQSGSPHPVPAFNQRPYLRLFNNLLHDLNTPDPLLDSNNVDVLACFAQHFRFLRPQRCPGFLFAWLELISHRMFMPKLLLAKTSGCSVLLARLLVDLFRFLQPYLRQADLTEVLRLAYKATLRLLLVLLHDFPEFLCEFHTAFCDVIPPSCIQMRNLILSAFPRSMRLPDPFTPNLKVDLLPEMTQPPRISSDITLMLQQTLHRHHMLLPLEHYLKHREPAAFFNKMLESLTLRASVLSTSASANPPPSAQQLESMHAAAVKRAGTPYNVPLINALVMYTGLAGINSLLVSSGKSGLVSQFQDSASMDVYEALLSGLDAEGRYYVLNAIANQLRYPNNHTHYFSCVLLYLFLQCKEDVLMEQMTRVLLERLIVHRPHPWGLLITFIELIKNPRYDFWRQPFTRCAPEIERLFESVARSCMPIKHAQNANATAGAANQTGAVTPALGSSVGGGNTSTAQAVMANENNPSA